MKTALIIMILAIALPCWGQSNYYRDQAIRDQQTRDFQNYMSNQYREMDENWKLYEMRRQNDIMERQLELQQKQMEQDEWDRIWRR